MPGEGGVKNPEKMPTSFMDGPYVIWVTNSAWHESWSYRHAGIIHRQIHTMYYVVHMDMKASFVWRFFITTNFCFSSTYFSQFSLAVNICHKSDKLDQKQHKKVWDWNRTCWFYLLVYCTFKKSKSCAFRVLFKSGRYF